MHVSPDHLIAQARERFAVQDYRGAVLLLDEVVTGGRAFADVHHLLGLSLSLLGQSDRALAEFDRALALNPAYLEAHIHRGLVLTELARHDEAAQAFQAAADCATEATGPFPPHVVGRLANQHAALGDAYAEAGALEPAIAQYREAVALGPGFVDLRYRLSRLLLEAGQTLSAREELERVLAERPNFVDAQAALGLARYLAGDTGGAEAMWRECLARRPENARVEAYLAMMGRADR